MKLKCKHHIKKSNELRILYKKNHWLLGKICNWLSIINFLYKIRFLKRIGYMLVNYGVVLKTLALVSLKNFKNNFLQIWQTSHSMYEIDMNCDLNIEIAFDEIKRMSNMKQCCRQQWCPKTEEDYKTLCSILCKSRVCARMSIVGR